MRINDTLHNVAAAYASAKWEEQDWRTLGRELGVSDLLDGHPRLYRSLGFGDPDYPDAAHGALGLVLKEGVDPSTGAAGRAQLLAEFMPDLAQWVRDEGPFRVKQQFKTFIDKLTPEQVPRPWTETRSTFSDSGEYELVDPAPPEQPLFGEDIWGNPTPLNPATTGRRLSSPTVQPKESTRVSSVFIVHGHDHVALNEVRMLAYNETGIVPQSLADAPGRGDTIIEKFERESAKASFVIVLLTPDDIGQSKVERQAKRPINDRARQNVVLELGYFIGKLGRDKVVVVDADVERPSDLAGLSYVKYGADNWKYELSRELKAADLVSP